MFYTYILANRRNGAIYTGMTDDLRNRLWQHKSKALKGFTAKYDISMLVWFETHDTREAAFRRERQIKEWTRSWRLELIEKDNPNWRDLGDDLNNLLPF